MTFMMIIFMFDTSIQISFIYCFFLSFSCTRCNINLHFFSRPLAPIYQHNVYVYKIIYNENTISMQHKDAKVTHIDNNEE